jgi:MarR-like DNA-binding transcriptional regulator SgrR of sgrS sRNA
MSSTSTPPINQAIYQALLDKAASYLDQNSYQAKAYKKAAESLAEYNQMQEWKKPVVYTAENPRRSKRNIGKPVVKYFTEEDEQDEIAEAIEAVCAKKGYEFSEDLITEFNAWLPTADKYSLEKYDVWTGKYIPRTKPDVAKQWAMYYSKSIQEQQKLKKSSKAIVKYCEKNNIEYQDVMADKFAAWKADPANKKLITYTYTSYNYGGCTCSGCDPTGEKKKVAAEVKTETSYYERTPAYCVKQWFSTLKKTVVF